MIPKIGNTTNNITNKFNMNIFLNEDCKDALNLMEFVDSLKIQMKDLVNTGKSGFVNGITNIFIRGLRELEMHKRPLHCSDLKREVLYVKDNDTWEKENENKDKITKAINAIKRNNMQQITGWLEENEDTIVNDKEKSDEYLQILQQSLGGNEEQQDKNIQKIIKNVAKEVCISKKIENGDDN
jgi:predicted MPP superfamily phosphohydrolase